MGIPTVTDRLVQQAFLQVLTPILDPTGAGFAIWQAKAHTGAGAVNEPGAFAALTSRAKDALKQHA